MLGNLYASFSSPNLALLSSTSNDPNSNSYRPRLPPRTSPVAYSSSYFSKNSRSGLHLRHSAVGEYEDILKRKSNPNSSYSISDILARESDVIISNKITPKTEYNGFAIHLLSLCLLIVWLAWALIPKSAFNSIGIYYYPDRWWQLAISSYVLIVMIYIYVGLALYNTEMKTAPLDDIRNIVDEHSVMAPSSSSYNSAFSVCDEKYLWNPTNGVWDLPVCMVSKVLYSDYQDQDIRQLTETQ